MIDHAENGMNRSSFGIVRSVYEAANAGMNERSRTHYARLNCSKEFAVDQTMITEVSSGFAQGGDLGVSGGIAIDDIAIPASSDDAPREYDDGSDWNLTGFECALGGAESFFHPELVGVGVAGLT
jgi:hypothetical protein